MNAENLFAAVDLRHDVRSRLIRFLRAASIEIAPKPLAVEHLRGAFDPGTEVFVNQTPAGEGGDVVATAVLLRQSGFEPVPHIAARNVASAAELDMELQRLIGEAGVSRVLAIAGDRKEPRGPFTSVLDLLATGSLQKSGISTVGIAAHPEGNPFADLSTLQASLVAKFRGVREAGLACFLVTQFCFEATPVLAFLASLDGLGIDAPVRIGLAGSAPTATLISFGERCGVGASLDTLKASANAAGPMLGDRGPEGLLHDLADGISTELADRVVGVHFYPFGGVIKTGVWLEATRAGLEGAFAEGETVGGR